MSKKILHFLFLDYLKNKYEKLKMNVQQKPNELYEDGLPPSVSVIMPTHNRGDMICRAIDSVLWQSYKDFELIIVSDGSTDNSKEIVEKYEDPRILFFEHNSSKGASAARNTGIKFSRGKYIAFLDDDDEWMFNKLALQVPVIEESSREVGLVYTWIEYISEGNKVNSCTPELSGNIFLEMLDKQAITNSSALMIKRDVLNKIEGFDESLPRGNDGDFIRRITKYYHVDYVPEVLVRVYIGHDDRISVNSKKQLLYGIRSKEARLKKFQQEYENNPSLKVRLNLQITKLLWQTNQYLKAFTKFLYSIKQSTSIKITIYELLRFIFKNLPPKTQLLINLMKKNISWRYQILSRFFREYNARFFLKLPKHKSNHTVKIVFMTGMPRTGTSLMKNYLGDFPQLKVMPFEPKGFYLNLKKAYEQSDRILIDKSTHYIRNLSLINAAAKQSIAFCCIVRDPRDQLASLLEFQRHPELPRNLKFWEKWYSQYTELIDFFMCHKEARLFLLRYEDLVRDPIKAKVSFLAWLNFEVDEKEIINSYSVIHQDDRQDEKVSMSRVIHDKSVNRFKAEKFKGYDMLFRGYESKKGVRDLMLRFGYHENELRDVDIPSTSNIHIFKN